MLRFAALAASVSLLAVPAAAEPNVVASIKPIHSLVAAVMDGVGEPTLIVEGAGSPHTYALKPSQARQLQDADAVFWIGHELEAFLEKPLETVAANAKSVELIDAHDLVKLDFREGGAFEAHDHGDHDDHGDEHAHDDHDHDHDHDKEHAHDDHDHDKEHADDDHDHDHDHDKEHAHDDHDHDHDHDKEHAHDDHDHDHDHDKEHAHDDHDHDDDHDEKHAHDDHDHDDHHHGEFDAHIWLDPANAKAMVHEIEEVLAEIDPANAAKYEANAEALEAKLDALIAEVSATVAPAKGKGFIVFHDAYQYFENRFGVTASGSITISPEVMPGASRIREIKDRIEDLGATCVFSEPQFEPKLVATVTEGTSAKSGVIDPLGAALEDGPELYFTLIRNMAASINGCLSDAG
ncbi:zinc ABC transporter substrate-binding protein [Oricola sp.]|uniref:zinc ABC transporter substrate-binding protein n=1 Tax=Oricola sp. TaxID=1979950 RepID=UPI003BABAA04